MSDMRDQDDLNLNKKTDLGGTTMERDRVTRGEVGENDLEGDDLDLDQDTEE